MKELIAVKDNKVITTELEKMEFFNKSLQSGYKELQDRQKQLNDDLKKFEDDRNKLSDDMWKAITDELKTLNLLPNDYVSGDTPLEINNGIICEYEDLEYIKKQFPGAPDNVIQEIFDTVMKEKEFKKSQKGAE